MPATNKVKTSHGTIAWTQSRGDGEPVLFIHGNSSCKEVFGEQFSSPLLSGYRLVAIDLPGHGESEDAPDPQASYSFGGYADMAGQVIAALGLGRPAVFGWSLGGHVGMEMIGRNLPVARLMTAGSPPVSPDVPCLMQAFNIDPNAENLTAKPAFSDDDALAYATHTSGVNGVVDPHLLAMVKRTDGRSRALMFQSVATGQPLNEIEIVGQSDVPLAIVNGAEDPFIKHEYFDALAYRALWGGKPVRLAGAAHAPFLQNPDAFNRLLAEFLKAA